MLVAGVDEAGRGSLISRVYTAITVLPENFMKLAEEEKIIIRDSKKMSKLQRNKARKFIETHAIDYNVQFEDEKSIDKVGILKATMMCMNRSVDALHVPIDKLYVDGNYYQNHRDDIPYDCIPEIACSSILAKTYRDEFIEKLYQDNQDLLQPYGIETNMGYGTKVHMESLSLYGYTIFHRKSFCKFSLFQNRLRLRDIL
jgi:ribonuclease HII